MEKVAVGCPPENSVGLAFYDSRRIASRGNQHSGLVPRIREKVGFPLSGWRPFECWSSAPTSLDQPYLLADRVRLFHASVKIRRELTPRKGLSQGEHGKVCGMGCKSARVRGFAHRLQHEAFE